MAKHIFAILAMAVVALSATPSAVQAKPCKCENFAALKSELALAMRLKAAFAAKAAELRKKYGEKPSRADDSKAAKDFNDFKEGMKTIAPSESGTGKAETRASTTFVPLGQKQEELNVRPQGDQRGIEDAMKMGPDGYTRVPDLEARQRIEDEWKKKNPGKDLCDPENGQAFYDDVKKGAACDGIAAAYLAHEMAHMATCKRMRYFAFRDRVTAEVADDEVRGYEAEIRVLSTEIDKVLKDKKTKVIKKPVGACPQCYLGVVVSCGSYRIKGQMEAIAFDEVICSLDKPFSLTSIGESKVVFQMSPASLDGGTYAYSGSGGGAMFAGTGRYGVKYNEDGSATMTFYSSGEATVGPVTVDDQGEGSFPLTPTECPEERGALERDLRGLANKAEASVCRVSEPKTCKKS